MNESSERPRDLRRLLTALFDGTLSSGESEQLEHILAEDAEARDFYRRYVELHAMLQFQQSDADGIALPSGSGEEFYAGDVRAFSQKPFSPPEAPAETPQAYGFLGNILSSLPGFGSITPMNLIMALLAAMVGGAVTALVLGGLGPSPFREPRQGAPDSVARTSVSVTPVAYLASTNGCYWGDGESQDLWHIGKDVQLGDELVLHEGIAEFRLASGVSLSIEGPAALVMTSQTSLVLQHGKVTVYVPWAVTDFRVSTSACRITGSDAEFGINVSGDKVDLHVFSGRVLATPALEGQRKIEVVEREVVEQEADLPSGAEFTKAIISTGRGLALVSRGDIVKVSQWHRADETNFATKLTMAGPLPITSSYVESVMASKPISYWRFEQSRDGMVPNEIPGAAGLKVIGDLKLAGDSTNQAAELGRPGFECRLVSESPIAQLGGSAYSIEAWIKPSHVHDGNVLALIADLSETVTPRTGFAIQLWGAQQNYRAEQRQRIRYLHRNPPGSHLKAGRSCYSSSPYLLRRWQHIVAVKEGPQMSLYFNGVPVASQVDRNELAQKLYLIVGESSVSKRVIPFVGQLDELAIYNRALSRTEIQKHIKTLNWKPPRDSSSPTNEI